MLISYHPRIMGMLMATLVALAVSCGSDEQTKDSAAEQPSPQPAYTPPQPGPLQVYDPNAQAGEPLPTDDPYYDGWETLTFENIKVHYPPDHPHREAIGRMADACAATIRKDCSLLNIPIPTDTIHVFYHVGPYTGREATRHLYPFAIGDTIHQFPPFYLGMTIMKYLLPRWQADETKHSFLKHGLLTLLDNSGRDYHERTFGLVDSGRFIPLRELAVDDKINSDVEFYRSAEAASFVDFIVFYYGIDALSGLYHADVSFETAARQLFGMSPDSLQQVWLHVVDSARAEIKNTN